MIWHFLAIFEKQQVSADQIYFRSSIPENRQNRLRARLSFLFFITGTLQISFIFLSCKNLPYTSKNNRQKENSKLIFFFFLKMDKAVFVLKNSTTNFLSIYSFLAFNKIKEYRRRLQKRLQKKNCDDFRLQSKFS